MNMRILSCFCSWTCFFSVQEVRADSPVDHSAYGASERITSPQTIVDLRVGESLFGTARSGNTIIGSGFVAENLRESENGEGGQAHPATFALFQNYPNPFNPSTTIVYRVESRELVSLKIFDLMGREVTTLVNEVKDPGSHEVAWDAADMASGVYFYRLYAGTFAQTKKLMLLR